MGAGENVLEVEFGGGAGGGAGGGLAGVECLNGEAVDGGGGGGGGGGAAVGELDPFPNAFLAACMAID